MKVIAEQGNRVYLLLVGEDMARVLDLDQGKLFPAFNVHSILARGYWEDTNVPLPTIMKLLESVDIMDDYPPKPGTMRATMYDIDSKSKLAVLDSTNGKLRVWENADPNAAPTINPGMREDAFDHIESWVQLIPERVQYRGKVYTQEDGDKFLFALVDQQPSNVVWWVAHEDTWKIEEHQKWREAHRLPWEM